MNWSQWIFEYRCLRQAEQEKVEREVMLAENTLRAAKNLAVQLFGLHLFPGAKPPKEGDDLPFLPNWLFSGHPQVIGPMLEQLQDEEDTAKATKDEKFEAFSDELNKALKTGKSELPDRLTELLTQGLGDIDKNPKWNDPRTQQMLTSMVKPRPKDAPAVPHIDVVPKVVKKRRDQLLKVDELERVDRGEPAVEIDEGEIERFMQALEDEGDVDA